MKSEYQLVRGALERVNAKQGTPEGMFPLHSHSCELSVRVDALEERVRILSAQHEALLLDTPKRQPGREVLDAATKRRTGSEG